MFFGKFPSFKILILYKKEKKEKRKKKKKKKKKKSMCAFCMKNGALDLL
jgi:hypothetical protein